ncbi:MAG: HAMP domain-containing protein [Desulfobacteraceae bacterium]|nr:HAMP domain-containing protein [Desulfobacteraceae bacterium]
MSEQDNSSFIGNILMQKQVISDNQLADALDIQKERLCLYKQPAYLGMIIVELGFASEEKVLNAIREHYQISVSSLSENIEELIEKKNTKSLKKRKTRARIPIWIQLAIAMTVIIILTVFPLSFVILREQKEELYEQTVKIGMISLNYFTNNARISLIEDNISRLNSLIKEAVTVKGLRFAIITDKHKIIKAHTDINKIGLTLDTHHYPKDVNSKDKNNVSYFTYMSPSGEYLLNLSRSVTFQDRELGKAYVGVSIDFINQLTRKKALFVIILTSVIIFFGILISVFLGRRLSRPVEKLVLATREIARGNYLYKVNLLPRNDEFSDLGKAFNKMGRELWSKLLMEKSFGKYVGSEVLQMIMANPESTWLKGTRKQATIILTDIRGFTAYSEANEPEEVVDKINEYFDIATSVIHEHGGYVDKFIGDAVLAIFGVPIPQEDHIESAVKAAIDMQIKLKAASRDGNNLLAAVGIGINSGVVVAGNIGSHERMEYTVIGDSVNLASRLNGFAESGEVIVSKNIYEHLGSKIEAKAIPPQQIKGKSGTFELFRVIRFL